MPVRPLYVASELFDWVDSTDALYSKKRGQRTLYEHLEQALCDFRCSDRPPAGELRRVMPTKRGVWKICPPGLRIFGWCPAPHSFVAVTAAFADETHAETSLTDAKVRYVRAFIARYELDETIEYGDVNALFP